MNILRIITRPKNIFSHNLCELKKNQQKNTFYLFNENLKLHFSKEIIYSKDYYMNNSTIEFHLDIFSYKDDIIDIKNNQNIQKLIKDTIKYDDTLIEFEFLKHTKLHLNNSNNIFLL